MSQQSFSLPQSGLTAHRVSPGRAGAKPKIALAPPVAEALLRRFLRDPALRAAARKEASVEDFGALFLSRLNDEGLKLEATDALRLAQRLLFRFRMGTPEAL